MTMATIGRSMKKRDMALAQRARPGRGAPLGVAARRGLRLDGHARPHVLQPLDDHALAGLEALRRSPTYSRRSRSPGFTDRDSTLLSAPRDGDPVASLQLRDRALRHEERPLLRLGGGPHLARTGPAAGCCPGFGKKPRTVMVPVPASTSRSTSTAWPCWGKTVPSARMSSQVGPRWAGRVVRTVDAGANRRYSCSLIGRSPDGVDGGDRRHNRLAVHEVADLRLRCPRCPRWATDLRPAEVQLRLLDRRRARARRPAPSRSAGAALSSSCWLIARSAARGVKRATSCFAFASCASAWPRAPWPGRTRPGTGAGRSRRARWP